MAVQLIEGFEAESIYLVTNPSGGAGIITSRSAGSWSRACYSPGVSDEQLPLRNTSGTRFFCAVRVYVTNFNKHIYGVYNSSNGTHFRVGINSTGQVVLYNAAETVVGTSTNSVYQSAWNLIECDVTIGDSAAGKVWLHGLSTEDINVTAQDFRNTDATGYAFMIKGNTGNDLDDIIVYDDTGTKWNSRVGDKCVTALFPSAIGDQEQWDPKKTGSAQRFYFPKALRSLSKDGFAAPVLPAFDSAWEYTSAVETDAVPRGRLAPEKYATSSPANGITDSRPAYDVSGTAPFDLLGAQYVSPALAAQTISGTAKMQMLVNEETAADNIASQLVIRVVSNDGQTVRGTLYAGDTDTTNPPSSEWATSATNRKFPRAALVPITLSSVVAQEGDRIVVELGGRMRGPARASVQMAFITGSNGTDDLPEDETDTTQTKTPWIEFSNALTLSDNGNWDHVTEYPPDDDGTYVSTSVDDDLDLYNLDALPASLAASGPIVIKTRAVKNDAGTRTLTHAYKTSGTTQTGSALPLPTGAYAYQRTYRDDDATDSNDWSDSKLNALQVGPKATT